LPLLVPLWSDAFRVGHVGPWLENLCVVPFVVALYAALFGVAWRQGIRSSGPESPWGLVSALLWVVVPQVDLCFEALWENEWTFATVGVGWWVRFALGVVVPALVAAAAPVASRDAALAAKTETETETEAEGGADSAAGSPAHRVRVLVSSALRSFMWTIVATCSVVPWTILTALSFLLNLDPFVVASARARDGTRAVVIETPGDPYDVLLSVQAPGKPWSYYRLAHKDALWPGDVHFDSTTQDLWVTAWDLDAAVLRKGTGKLEATAPLWGLAADPWPYPRFFGPFDSWSPPAPARGSTTRCK
jgi:hypothetical protein